MSAPIKKPATYRDLVDLPVPYVGEILSGELYASPRPAPRHSVAASALGSELGGAFQAGRQGPGGWWILDEPELHLGEDVLVPDIAGWRRERMPEVPDEAFFSLVPDWVCEILSPATAQLDMVRKLPRYAAAGVEHAWVIDPALRSLQAFRRQARSWLLLASFTDDARLRAEPFDAFELDLALLWGKSLR